MSETANKLIWDAVDRIKDARAQLEVARGKIVMAQMGEKSLKLQKRLFRLDSELTALKKTVARCVGIRMDYTN